MKVIALIGTYDTKFHELGYVKEMLAKENIGCITIDCATLPGHISSADFTPAMVFAAGGRTVEEVRKMKKYEMLTAASEGARALVDSLYKEGKINGAMSLGGLQNSNMGCYAMQALPVGIPKIMVSTVACGQRVFEPMTGTKDVIIFPAITDFTGINVVNKAVILNAIAAMSGMLSKAGKEIEKGGTAIGTTFMGATNDGVVNTINFLEEAGHNVISFHSTGGGGRAMEELIDAGIVTSACDMTLHEVVYEYFGYGFGYGANNRVAMGAKKGIPMVICPGGVDFMCQWRWQLFDDVEDRVYNWHNQTLAHVMLRPKEAIDISNMIIDRLNTATGPVSVVLPTQGLRSLTRPGEELYEPNVDNAIIDTFAKNLRKDIPIRYYEGNFSDIGFSRFVADEMLNVLDLAKK